MHIFVVINISDIIVNILLKTNFTSFPIVFVYFCVNEEK